MTMTKESPERAERRARQKEIADGLKASGALDDIFAKIDAGEPLTGEQGLLGGMLKAALERGLDAELTEHVGYDRGDPDADQFANSRNGTSAKTVASQIGDIDLAVPRDRSGTFSPMLVPKSQRQLGGLDAMIVPPLRGRCPQPLRGRDDAVRHPAPPRLDDRDRDQPRNDQQGRGRAR